MLCKVFGKMVTFNFVVNQYKITSPLIQLYYLFFEIFSSLNVITFKGRNKIMQFFN